MIKILSNEPNTVFYKDVKVGESFVYPKYPTLVNNTVYVKTRNTCYTLHNETCEASCVDITNGELTDFDEDDEVCLVDATVKWEYCNKKE